MYNFFVKSDRIKENKIEIQEEDVNHIVNVIRLKIGDKIFISNIDNAKMFLSEINYIDKQKVICTIIKEVNSTEPKIKVSIFQGIPKFDKMEYIIQKAVELGVYEIIPLEMKNCIAKIKDDKKIIRWNEISKAAAKQSKRNIVPQIKNVMKFKELFQNIEKYDLILVAYEEEVALTIKDILEKNKNIKSIAVIVGPEGGIDIKEYEELKKMTIKSVSLGKRILRTDTVALNILSILMYCYDL